MNLKYTVMDQRSGEVQAELDQSSGEVRTGLTGTGGLERSGKILAGPNSSR